MSRNIYKGYNFIFEQMAAETTGKKDDLSSIIYGIVPPVLSAMTAAGAPETKTSSSFKAFSDSMLAVKDFNGLKDLIMSEVEKIKSEGKEEFKKGISELFDQLMKVPDVNKKFDFSKETIKSILDETGTVIEEVEKIAEKPVNEKFGSLDSTDFPKAKRSGKAYVDTADRLMRAATSLYMDTRPGHLEPKIAQDPDIQKFVKRAEQIFKVEAPELQIEGKRGGLLGLGKIKTEGGKEKGRDFYIKVDRLMDEIGTIRNEIAKMRGKTTNVVVTPPTPPSPVPPKTETGDTTATATTSKEGTETAKTDSGDSGVSTCGFPIGISSRRCKEIADLQNKLMKIPCIEEVLSKHGGADGKFGKYTSAAVHSAYNAITGKDEKSAVVTEEMYKAIMAADFGGAVKESMNNSIFEMEYNKGGLLGFDDFNCVSKVYEQQSDLVSKICDKFKAILPTIPGKKGIGRDKVEDVKPSEGGGPNRDDWSGLKYPISNTYSIPFDESLASFWAKEAALTAISFALPGSGLLLKAGSQGIRSLGSKAAAGLGAKKLATKIAGKAATRRAAATGIAASKLLGGAAKMNIKKYAGLVPYKGAKYITIPKRLKSGLIGGALGGAALDFLSGRDTVSVTIINGFIERDVILMITKGMVNTIDGYVSDEDFASIANLLAVIKGCWTVDESDKAISAWGELKRLYKTAEGEDLSSDIKSIKPKVGDVEGFPNLRSENPQMNLKDMDWDIAVQEVRSFVDLLDSNEKTMTSNISKISPEYVKASIEGKYVEVDSNGDIIDNEKKD